uniref:Uncharacterized protein n=1 Tax=Oryza nivara TaxID=4536 RepID=A0A0E0I540_ORYNI
MAALAVVHGWLAPALSRRAETGGGSAALPCRRPRLVAVACAASSVNTATTTGESPLGSDGSAAAAMSLERAFAGGDGGGGGGIGPAVESTVEKLIFDFRFLALLAVAGSLAGSLLCFLSGCVYIKEAYHVYWTSCVRGVHTGQMVLRLVEAIDVYLAGTVMLIFGMGLYGLFISNDFPDVPASDRALKGSSLFGMFALKERPRWMRISSLGELKTKLGHIIVMILLVKMFERSKMVHITTGMDLLSYAVCIFLSSASLYILHNLHRPEHE